MKKTTKPVNPETDLMCESSYWVKESEEEERVEEYGKTEDTFFLLTESFYSWN